MNRKKKILIVDDIAENRKILGIHMVAPDAADIINF